MSVTQLPVTVDGLRQILTYSRESADRMLGVFGQEEEIMTWADTHGYMIAGYARDNETRGVVPADDRDGLSAALRALQGPSNVRGLVVSHLDRIARSVPVMLDVVDRIWAAGRDLYSLFHGGLIPRTFAGRELCRKAAEFAAYELSVIQWRVQQRRRAKTARGGYSGGARIHRRYGVELVPHGDGFRYQRVPAEQETMRRICAEHASGVGYQRIARTLNSEGIPSATGRAWSPKVVRDIVLRGPDKLSLLPEGMEATDVSALVVPFRRGVGA